MRSAVIRNAGLIVGIVSALLAFAPYQASAQTQPSYIYHVCSADGGSATLYWGTSY